MQILGTVNALVVSRKQTIASHFLEGCRQSHENDPVGADAVRDEVCRCISHHP